MKAFTISFMGRKAGAFGITHRITATRIAENLDMAVLALYDEYENISKTVVVSISAIGGNNESIRD